MMQPQKGFFCIIVFKLTNKTVKIKTGVLTLVGIVVILLLILRCHDSNSRCLAQKRASPQNQLISWRSVSTVVLWSISNDIIII